MEILSIAQRTHIAKGVGKDIPLMQRRGGLTWAHWPLDLGIGFWSRRFIRSFVETSSFLFSWIGFRIFPAPAEN